jgi:hypothetical protein
MCGKLSIEVLAHVKCVPYGYVALRAVLRCVVYCIGNCDKI